MPQVFTPYSFAAALRAVGPDINRRIGNVLGAGLSRAEKYAVEDFTSRGIGRGIFGRKPDGVLRQRAISRTRVTIQGNRFIGGLKAQGLAALQEGGGRTKPHRIPRRGTTLMAFTSGGEQRFAMSVNHPGGAVPRYPFLQKAMERAEIAQAIDREVTQYLARKLG